MVIEVLNTGSELLLGDVVNSHLAELARRLAPFGLRIGRQTSVPDGAPIRSAMAEAIGRCDILLVTGGLGPTTDDVTREVATELLGLPLEKSEPIEAAIRARLESRGYRYLPRMARQAMVPRGAEVLPNSHGTAPGLYIPPIEEAWRSTPHIFLLPGPPRELLPMLADHVLPRLKNLAEATGAPILTKRIYRIIGMGESAVEEAVGAGLLARGDIELGYCARPNEVDLRLIAPAAVLDAVEPGLLATLGDHVFSSKDEELEECIVSALTRLKKTLAVAESCTGGLLASRITDVPGASVVFLGGAVTYSNSEKNRALGVPAELIEQHGAVSAPVAEAMAEGVRDRVGADFALSLTGIAGPGGGSPEKPEGTVFIGFAEKARPPRSSRLLLLADRPTLKRLATQRALDILRRRLLVAP